VRPRNVVLDGGYTLPLSGEYDGSICVAAVVQAVATITVETRMTTCHGMPGTVPELEVMSHILGRVSPGQWNVS